MFSKNKFNHSVHNNQTVAQKKETISTTSFEEFYNPNSRSHLTLWGETGCGKSTIIKQIALSNILNGVTTVCIDYKGGLYEDLLALLPALYRNNIELMRKKVHLIDFNLDYSPCLNVLKCKQDIDLIIGKVASILNAFTSYFKWSDNRWGDRIQNCLSSALPLIIWDGGTFDDLLSFLELNGKYRQYLIAKYENTPELYDQIRFWKNDFESWTKQEKLDNSRASSIRVNTFLIPTVKRAFCTEHLIDLPTILDEPNNVVLINFAQGKYLNSEAIKLVSSFIFSNIYENIMQRSERVENNPVQVIIDEAHLAINKDMALSMAEWRAKKASLLLASQSLSQYKSELGRDLGESIANDIISNSNPYLFEIDDMTADHLCHTVFPRFMRKLVWWGEKKGYSPDTLKAILMDKLTIEANKYEFWCLSQEKKPVKCSLSEVGHLIPQEKSRTLEWLERNVFNRQYPYFLHRSIADNIIQQKRSDRDRLCEFVIPEKPKKNTTFTGSFKEFK